MSSDRVDMQVNQMATEPNARTADKVGPFFGTSDCNDNELADIDQ